MHTYLLILDAMSTLNWTLTYTVLSDFIDIVMVAFMIILDLGGIG